ncbi:MAG: DsbA family protein [Neisseriaceae bacterium]|jgi:thiol:disulfide interchange protein DsbA
MKIKKILMTVLACVFVFSTFAIGSFTPKEGVDYTVISSKSKTKLDKHAKVNVKVFFSFTCIHCKDLEPLMQKFIASNKNTQVEMVHVVWGDDPTIKSLAKLNATLTNEELKNMKLKRLYVPIFNALFANQNLTDPNVLKGFLSKNGLTKAQIDKFFSVYNSFDVNATIGNYKSMTADPKYAVSGTPTIVVADKYIVSPAQPDKLIQVTSALVNQISTGK